jgi:glycosyltransferase involved in cell wall biosynthesis
MDFTLLIATHNRADDLRITLESARALRIPAGLAWELLVVANACSDATVALCTRMAGQLPLRVIEAPIPGKSRALNLGVAQASGEWIFQTDDDVLFDPGWADALWSATWTEPRPAFAGGRLLADPQMNPPRWICENAAALRFLPRVDAGPVARDLRNPGDGFLAGANFCYRRNAALAEPYREDLGPDGDNLSPPGSGQREPAARHVPSTLCEETELQERWLRSGRIGRYVPGAVIYHRDAPSRHTERYLRQWHFRTGCAAVVSGAERPVGRRIFGAPGYLWKGFAGSTLAALLSRPWSGREPSRACIAHQTRAAEALGQIHACRSLRP